MNEEDEIYLLSLINKLQDGTISSGELEQLSNFFVSHQNYKEWPIEIALKERIKEEVFAKIQLKISNKIEASTKIPLYKQSIFKYAVAACMIALISIPFFLKENVKIENTLIENTIKIGTDKATLTLEDGTQITLEKGKVYKNDALSSNGEKVIYNTEGTASKSEIAYNYLTVPRGGQHQLNLSDGTKVWLSSESQLKYPVAFTKGKTRQVELIYGEVYFKVSPSTEHSGSKFKVQTGLQEVEVLGTEFNIKAYQDEDFMYTTLVEGKVSVSIQNKNAILKPGEQSIINSDGEIKVSVVDVDSVVDWMRGVFSFKGKSLKEICKILSRWYDVDIIVENKDFDSFTFKGVIKKSNSIELILEALINSSDLNSYEIVDKIIYIK